MRSTGLFACLLWKLVRAPLNEKELSELEMAIRNDVGIVSVGHSEKDRHLMLVMYSPEKTKSINILHSVANQQKWVHPAPRVLFI